MTDSPSNPDDDRHVRGDDGTGAGDKRWRLMADVAVFQGKLVLDSLRDLVLSPISLGAALFGIVTNREEPGRYFYRLMQWGHWSDRTINLFHSKGAPQTASQGQSHDPAGPNVDRIADELERALIERYARSAFARSAKDTIDRSLDRVTGAPPVDTDRLRGAARRIARRLERTGIRRARRPDSDSPADAGTLRAPEDGE